jgi:hypothetical protein
LIPFLFFSVETRCCTKNSRYVKLDINCLFRKIITCHHLVGGCVIYTFTFFYHYTPRNEVVGGYTGFTMSVCRQILCRTITWVVFLRILKFYQLLTGEERMIPFFFDDFHFCRSRVIGLDMMGNRIFTLCRMITWVVFLRMFWNFISSLPVKRGGSLSFLTIFTLPFQSYWTWYDGK